MGREVKRVPLSFNWPLREVWDGYLMPKRLCEKDCDACESGYSPGAERRLGVPEVCSICDGYGSIERWPGQRAEAEAWERVEPPAGDGWQMWETTSEGSPISPVFETAEALADWLAESFVSMFGSTAATRQQWLSIITGESFAHVQIAPGVVII